MCRLRTLASFVEFALAIVLEGTQLCEMLDSEEPGMQLYEDPNLHYTGPGLSFLDPEGTVP